MSKITKPDYEALYHTHAQILKKEMSTPSFKNIRSKPTSEQTALLNKIVDVNTSMTLAHARAVSSLKDSPETGNYKKVSLDWGKQQIHDKMAQSKPLQRHLLKTIRGEILKNGEIYPHIMALDVHTRGLASYLTCAAFPGQFGTENLDVARDGMRKIFQKPSRLIDKPYYCEGATRSILGHLERWINNDLFGSRPDSHSPVEKKEPSISNSSSSSFSSASSSSSTSLSLPTPVKEEKHFKVLDKDGSKVLGKDGSFKNYAQFWVARGSIPRNPSDDYSPNSSTSPSNAKKFLPASSDPKQDPSVLIRLDAQPHVNEPIAAYLPRVFATYPSKSGVPRGIVFAGLDFLYKTKGEHPALYFLEHHLGTLKEMGIKKIYLEQLCGFTASDEEEDAPCYSAHKFFQGKSDLLPTHIAKTKFATLFTKAKLEGLEVVGAEVFTESISTSGYSNETRLRNFNYGAANFIRHLNEPFVLFVGVAHGKRRRERIPGVAEYLHCPCIGLGSRDLKPFVEKGTHRFTSGEYSVDAVFSDVE